MTASTTGRRYTLSKPCADVRLVVTIPRTPKEALEKVLRAAAWLKIEFHSDDCRRNSGWGKHFSQRWAYEILLAAAERIQHG